jgi:ureidoglycolate hydrolase
MQTVLSIPVEPLDPTNCMPYGWMLGKSIPVDDADTPAFASPASDFWREHLFDTGSPGPTEILWVIYRNSDENVTSLELHRLTEQAIVPLTAPVIHVVATSAADGTPDLDTVRAFAIPIGAGLCMRPNIWHATRVTSRESTCLMLTRPSTTYDLVVHLKAGAPASESEIQAIATLRLMPHDAQQ